ncbi:hydantoinase B/oxoprolinase family protein [Pelagicoccus mobilis]|uniref:Hydantoinase B/oxoprolinase family protein n=1 Tax=Pelagicoccus mobilis TaxID=415221 RepID=A0A934VQK2_9BACT|nr:hydantoinase B/oxoprolinase family protein [Pelagicoccus mobilis]MBK1876668.1 hydantoinase B/oxoprolinase family protein [Pelagicoccus mobilis]
MWKFWIDTGGTFTDCIAEGPDGETRRVKCLSSSAIRGHVVERIDARRVKVDVPFGEKDGFYVGYGFLVLGIGNRNEVIGWDSSEGILTLAEDLEGSLESGLCELQSPEEPPVLAVRILTETGLEETLPPLEMRLATTRGTNALLERKGATLAFLVTEGFGDLLKIGNQQRPDLFELGIQKDDPLPESVFEVSGRIDAAGNELEALDEVGVRAFAKEALAQGVEAFSVALMHSYVNPVHERRVAEILREEGATFVSVSSELAAFAKILPRAETTVVDGYLAPIMEAYLDSVGEVVGGGNRVTPSVAPGAVEDLRSTLLQAPTLRVMTSAGGLVSRSHYRPKDSLLSGPAGGVVGSSRSGLQVGIGKSIAFDMGGTSTDVSRFDGQLDYKFEQKIGAARVYAPSLRIETVAAGGGSICWFDGTALRVGPESAGANPGPACYGAGGPLAVTDVNLLLGRLDASKFGIPVFPEAAKERLTELIDEIERTTGQCLSEQETLEGLLAIANETMAEAIRKISTSEGFDPADYALVAFGGAGGLHACAIAGILGMDTIVFPADAGLLSAYGLKHAQVEQFAERQVLELLVDCESQVAEWLSALEAQALRQLEEDGVSRGSSELCPARFELRYRGQESIIVLEGGEVESLGERFGDAYESQFGFVPRGLAIELVAIRVVARSQVVGTKLEEFRGESRDKHAPTKAFVDRNGLEEGDTIEGPVVIQDPYSTIYVDAGWKAQVGTEGTLRMESTEVSIEKSELAEVVELELFTNRFLALVGEMGALLERAAFSTNVKDRKDFSCALLDADGYLLANAPHIPVHLGALGVCLRTVLQSRELGPGDVVVTNHPAFGGSHLPDVTLIAPVYTENGDELLGYVANRAHHAELGGISPGSMPPNAKSLAEEGVVIAPLKLVEAGVTCWEPLLDLLKGCAYPSRSVEENVADLSAQLASIRRGQRALQELAEAEGEKRVAKFMGLLRKRAATALREALKSGRWDNGRYLECLDDGAAVQVQVSKQVSGKWLIDFEGSSGVQPNNYNATPAIVTSAVIYVLRLVASVDVPLNEGFLDVVDIRIPEGMLNPVFDSNPEACPAVVAGNVEVSQLVVSVLLKAFGLAACSQSTMNNLIFGTESFGYYETIAGGEGATPERDGASGVHTHMTNTAMTDPEVMELRYPVKVEIFGLRENSGGSGLRRGGDGVVKRVKFLKPVTLSLLTQRRIEQPFGVEGGGAGACGEQILVKADGSVTALDGNGSWELETGEVLEIRTPGGGGWGEGGV